MRPNPIQKLEGTEYFFVETCTFGISERHLQPENVQALKSNIVTSWTCILPCYIHTRIPSDILYLPPCTFRECTLGELKHVYKVYPTCNQQGQEEVMLMSPLDQCANRVTPQVSNLVSLDSIQNVFFNSTCFGMLKTTHVKGLAWQAKAGQLVRQL